jgi:hypothetical protein
MWIRVHSRKLLAGLLAMLTALARLALWMWGQSPYARFLDREELEILSLPEDTLLLVVFAGGWTLMTVAMMLLTSLPLILTMLPA